MERSLLSLILCSCALLSVLELVRFPGKTEARMVAASSSDIDDNDLNRSREVSMEGLRIRGLSMKGVLNIGMKVEESPLMRPPSSPSAPLTAPDHIPRHPYPEPQPDPDLSFAPPHPPPQM